MRWCVVAVAAIHGLIHLLGVAEGFGWADVPQLTEPISGRQGVAWLLAALLSLATALMLALRLRGWWLVATAAALGSQAVILTAWDDAVAGTLANVVLLLAAGYGYASEGPHSFRAEYRRRTAAMETTEPDGVVTEQDLARLPAPVAEYVRQSGAVGRPRVTQFRATFHGRIRPGPDKPWMPFTGSQTNTYGEHPSRVFFMDATMRGLPADVLHVYDDSGATMRVRAASVIPVVSAAGPEMDRAETVTLFNDLCLLAPAALVDAPVVWDSPEGRRVRGAFTHAGHTVTAELVFDDEHRLVDFVSDDRLRASTDGKTFTPLRWSTPVTGYRDFGDRRVGAIGEARWHAPPPEGEFAYLELVVDDIAYDVTSAKTASQDVTS